MHVFKDDEDICGVCHDEKPKHRMWCKDCKKVHFICEYCYDIGKEKGIIVDYKGDITALDPNTAEELR